MNNRELHSKFHLNINLPLFYIEGAWPGCPRGCGVSILCSGQPALADPAWARGLDWMTSRGAFQPQWPPGFTHNNSLCIHTNAHTTVTQTGVSKDAGHLHKNNSKKNPCSRSSLFGSAPQPELTNKPITDKREVLQHTYQFSPRSTPSSPGITLPAMLCLAASFHWFSLFIQKMK